MESARGIGSSSHPFREEINKIYCTSGRTKKNADVVRPTPAPPPPPPPPAVAVTAACYFIYCHRKRSRAPWLVHSFLPRNRPMREQALARLNPSQGGYQGGYRGYLLFLCGLRSQKPRHFSSHLKPYRA